MRLDVGPFAFGAAGIGNLYEAVSEEDAASAVEAALAAGVRYFDTAPHYGLGLSERRLGAAIAGVPRADLVLSTKVGRLLVSTGTERRDDEGFDVVSGLRRVWDFSRDGVLRSLEASMARLGTDRIDVVFVHDPDEHYAAALDGALPALSALRDQGVIGRFGVGMNQSRMLTRFVEHSDLDTVLLAGRYTLLDQSGMDDLLPVCRRRGVSVVAAGVFNSGILATEQPGDHYDYRVADPSVVSLANRLAAVCALHGVTLPQAAVWFPLLHPAVTTVCLGARSAREVIRNAGLFDHPVPDSLWQDLIAAGLLRADAPMGAAR
ncbi:MAG TPA: aldo/keto reductase [Pseudonocardiaceae bacterium]|nr:aldo/keto reductase [Pseudonocardiaceae bacterium]